jgi:hypothetical protein
MNTMDEAFVGATGNHFPFAGESYTAVGLKVRAKLLHNKTICRSTAGSHHLRWLEDINLLRVMVKA